jgi:Domain of unknown function (DUF5615)
MCSLSSSSKSSETVDTTTSVHEVPGSGTSDQDVFDFARAEGRAIVTEDISDFRPLVEAQLTGGEHHWRRVDDREALAAERSRRADQRARRVAQSVGRSAARLGVLAIASRTPLVGYCGRATASLHIGGKTYRFKNGSCLCSAASLPRPLGLVEHRSRDLRGRGFELGERAGCGYACEVEAGSVNCEVRANEAA